MWAVIKISLIYCTLHSRQMKRKRKRAATKLRNIWRVWHFETFKNYRTPSIYLSGNYISFWCSCISECQWLCWLSSLNATNAKSEPDWTTLHSPTSAQRWGIKLGSNPPDITIESTINSRSIDKPNLPWILHWARLLLPSKTLSSRVKIMWEWAWFIAFFILDRGNDSKYYQKVHNCRLLFFSKTSNCMQNVHKIKVILIMTNDMLLLKARAWVI